MAQLWPINIHVPIVAGNNIARVTAANEIVIREFSGSLRVLVAGTYSIDIVNNTTAEILGNLSWTSAGVQRASLDAFINNGDGLRIDNTSLGIGALDCFLTVWAFSPRVDD